MSREYQRLHEEATAVDWEIQELQGSCRVRSAAELATLERRLDCLTVKRASLTKAMILLSSAEHPAFADEQRAFVSQLPHRYHSQGTRQKIVSFRQACDFRVRPGFTRPGRLTQMSTSRSPSP